jgi:hypothetical protein
MNSDLLKSCKYCGAITIGIIIGYMITRMIDNPINLKLTNDKKNKDIQASCSCDK